MNYEIWSHACTCCWTLVAWPLHETWSIRHKLPVHIYIYIYIYIAAYQCGRRATVLLTRESSGAAATAAADFITSINHGTQLIIAARRLAQHASPARCDPWPVRYSNSYIHTSQPSSYWRQAASSITHTVCRPTTGIVTTVFRKNTKSGFHCIPNTVSATINLHPAMKSWESFIFPDISVTNAEH